MKYCQCTLVKTLSSTMTLRQTTYIPEKFAKLDEYVRLKDEDGKWENGWLVINVGEATDCPPDYRKGIRSHRKSTGDSLKK